MDNCGKNCARATPICAFAATSCCSACRMSGRRSSNREGKPTGRFCGGGFKRVWIACERRVRDSGRAEDARHSPAAESAARAAESATDAVYSSSSAWRRSDSGTDPPLSSVVVSSTDSCRVFKRFLRDRQLLDRRARSWKYAVATCCTSVMRTARCAQVCASNCGTGRFGLPAIEAPEVRRSRRQKVEAPGRRWYRWAGCCQA